MATDFISRSEFDRKMQERYCFNCERKGNHPIFGVACKACWVLDMLDEVEQFQSADVRPVDEISDSVDEAIDYLSSVSNQMPYHVYSALFDLICGICPTCGADMRQVVEIEQVKEGAE